LFPELVDGAENNTSAWRKTLENLAILTSDNLATALAALFVESATPQQVAAAGRRFKYSNKEIELASWLVKQLPQVAAAAQLPWPQLQRILTNESAPELLALALAVLGDDHAGVKKCQEYLQLPSEKLNPAPLLTGDDLVHHGYQPGPHFAAILTAVRNAQLEGQISGLGEALRLADQLIQTQDFTTQTRRARRKYE
jgi:hypothetical protein